MEYNKSLNKIKTLLVKYSGSLLMTSGIACTSIAAIPDFQNVAVYQVPNNIKNGTATIKIVRRFDRFNTVVGNNWRLVSEINQSYPYLKIILAIQGIILSSAALAVIIRREKNLPIKEYQEAIDQTKAKMTIDFSMTAHQEKSRIESEIEVLELHQELYKNPVAREILNQQIATANGESEENYESHDEPIIENNTNLWEESTTDYFTDSQVKQIFDLMNNDKLSIATALKQTMPGYNSNHSHWKEIKDELVIKIKKLS